GKIELAPPQVREGLGQSRYTVDGQELRTPRVTQDRIVSSQVGLRQAIRVVLISMAKTRRSGWALLCQFHSKRLAKPNGGLSNRVKAAFVVGDEVLERPAARATDASQSTPAHQ